MIQHKPKIIVVKQKRYLFITNTMAAHNFQVDLEGIIRLLSKNLYSSETVFIRELIQNSRDAWLARYLKDPENCPPPRLEFHLWHYPEEILLEIEDHGIGLTEDEVHQFVATIGASSKHGSLSRETNFIGQFGIGLLSCFMVASEIRLLTKSAKGGPTLLWIGKNDGTYTLETKVEMDRKPGSVIFLRAKREKRLIFTASRISHLIRQYANYIPVPITLETETGTEQVNLGHMPWEQVPMDQMRMTMLRVGKEELNTEYLDAFLLRHPDDPDTIIGVGYVKNNRRKAKGLCRVYHRNMLLMPSCADLLPYWAFFVDVIINYDALTPTASREEVVRDDAFNQLCQTIDQQLGVYLKVAFANDAHLRNTLLLNHMMTLLTFAKGDDDFFEIVYPHIPVQTNRGTMMLGEVIAESDTLYYTDSNTLFGQLEAVANSQNLLIMEAHTNSALELITRYKKLNPDYALQPITTQHLLTLLGEEAELTSAEADFLEASDDALAVYGLRCVMQVFTDPNLPAMFFPRKNTQPDKFRERWQRLAQLSQSEKTDSLSRGALCFNQQNSLVQSLMRIESKEPQKFAAMIRLLYLNCLKTARVRTLPWEEKILEKSLFKLAGLEEPGEEK